MKKFMLGMIVLSVMVFGADSEKTNQQIPGLNSIEAQFKEVKFVESKLPQITLNIPIDIEKAPAGKVTEYGTILPGQSVQCSLSRNGEGYYQRRAVKPGSNTLVMRFYNIPLTSKPELLKYHCYLLYATDQYPAILALRLPLNFDVYQIDNESSFLF